MVSFAYNRREFSKIAEQFNLKVNKEFLWSIVRLHISNVVTPQTADVVDESGTHFDLGRVSEAFVKPSSIAKKGVLAAAVALVSCSEANLATWYTLMPERQQRLLRLAVEKLYVTDIEICEILRLKAVKPKKTKWSFLQPEPSKIIDNNTALLVYDRNLRWYDDEPSYFFLPQWLHGMAKVAISRTPEFKPTTALTTEDDALTMLDTVWEYFASGVVTVGKAEMVTATTVKKIDVLGFKTIPEDAQVEQWKLNSLRVRLVALGVALVRSHTGKVQLANATDSLARLRLVVGSLRHFRADVLRAMTKFYCGVANYERDQSGYTYIFEAVSSTLCRMAGHWLTVEQVAQEVRCTPDFPLYALTGFMVTRDYIYPPVKNEYSGAIVGPGNSVEQVGMPMLRLVLNIMAALGLVDIATDAIDDSTQPASPVSPFDNITAVRINPLGLYALGAIESYARPNVSQSSGLTAMDSHLIVRAEGERVPQIGMLERVAESLGNGRWAVTPRSFMSSCSSMADVQNLIDWFSRHVGNATSPVWQNFFNRMLRHVKPLKKETPDDYHIFSAAGIDPELLALLDSDARLNELVIRAAGYRLLVRKADYPKFVARLKALGFLL